MRPFASRTHPGGRGHGSAPITRSSTRTGNWRPITAATGAALRIVGQLVDSRQQQPVQRLRDLDRGDVRGGDPARAFLHDRAALDEHSDDLFDEERVAFRPREDQVSHARGQRFDLQQVGHEGLAVGLREGLELDLGERLAEQLPRVATRRAQPGASVSARIAATKMSGWPARA